MIMKLKIKEKTHILKDLNFKGDHPEQKANSSEK